MGWGYVYIFVYIYIYICVCIKGRKFLINLKLSCVMSTRKYVKIYYKNELFVKNEQENTEQS